MIYSLIEDDRNLFHGLFHIKLIHKYSFSFVDLIKKAQTDNDVNQLKRFLGLKEVFFYQIKNSVAEKLKEGDLLYILDDTNIYYKAIFISSPQMSYDLIKSLSYIKFTSGKVSDNLRSGYTDCALVLIKKGKYRRSSLRKLRAHSVKIERMTYACSHTKIPHRIGDINLLHNQVCKEILIPEEVIKAKWRALDEKFDVHFNLSETEIQNGFKPPKCIGTFSDYFDNIELENGQNINLWISYDGDRYGGHSCIFYYDNYERFSIKDLVHEFKNIDGILEYLYLGYEIPRKGNFWHGLYRTHKYLLFSVDKIKDLIFDIYQDQSVHHLSLLYGLGRHPIRITSKNKNWIIEYLLHEMGTYKKETLELSYKLKLDIEENVLLRTKFPITY